MNTTEASSFTKISRPGAKGIICRQRLFRLLDGGRDSPVTWISGPAGSGKTSLVSSYLDFRKPPCIWYQIDEGDANLPTFFYYMGVAARREGLRNENLCLF